MEEEVQLGRRVYMIAESPLEQLFTARDRDGSHSVEVRLMERRKNRRAALRWTVYVTGEDSMRPFRTETRDISKDSLYCVVDRPVRPGERLVCDIVVPTHNAVRATDVAFLRCRVHVVRVEEADLPGYFGVGCTIEEHHLVYGHAETSAGATEPSPEP